MVALLVCLDIWRVVLLGLARWFVSWDLFWIILVAFFGLYFDLFLGLLIGGNVVILHDIFREDVRFDIFASINGTLAFILSHWH